jgi:hypothetical protein
MKISLFLLALFIVACSAVSKTRLRTSTRQAQPGIVYVPVGVENSIYFTAKVNSTNQQRITVTNNQGWTQVFTGSGLGNKVIGSASILVPLTETQTTGQTFTILFQYNEGGVWKTSNVKPPVLWENGYTDSSITISAANDDNNYNDAQLVLYRKGEIFGS